LGNGTLVAYGSWAGSTAEVAEAIAGELRTGGASVDVRPAREVTDLGPYAAVVLGGAVRAGRLHADVARFVARHQAALVGMPVAYFVACLTMKGGTPESRAASDKFLDGLRGRFPDVKPVAVGLFGGALRCDADSLSKLPLGQRLVLTAMKKMAGDYRDWDAIRQWAREVRAKIESTGGQGGR
jgi:menaquinone-dependent protoporphyrinogen oxidase